MNVFKRFWAKIGLALGSYHVFVFWFFSLMAFFILFVPLMVPELAPWSWVNSWIIKASVALLLFSVGLFTLKGFRWRRELPEYKMAYQIERAEGLRNGADDEMSEKIDNLIIFSQSSGSSGKLETWLNFYEFLKETEEDIARWEELNSQLSMLKQRATAFRNCLKI